MIHMIDYFLHSFLDIYMSCIDSINIFHQLRNFVYINVVNAIHMAALNHRYFKIYSYSKLDKSIILVLHFANISCM